MDEVVVQKMVDKTVCDAYMLAHSNSICDAQQRIKDIEDTIKSLPHEVRVIQEALNKMSDSMDKLLERLEEKYVSKELYEHSMKAMLDSFADYKAMKDKESQDIANKQDWIMRGVAILCLYIVRELALVIMSR